TLDARGVASVKTSSVTPPKWATTKYDVPGALLHNITEEDTREQLLKVSFEKMPSKRNSASAALASKTPAMTQAAIRQLVVDSVATTLETQVATMENADNANRNPESREAHVARKCSYKEFMSYQRFNFKDCKVKFATGTLTKEALSWWNSFAQPIGIEKAYKITWVEFKKLLLKKYYPRTEIQNMEDEFYHLTVKGNDLKTYVRSSKNWQP
nr:reverse transcriptase domain-containing protein [Tanacetum cinerariifolium]